MFKKMNISKRKKHVLESILLTLLVLAIVFGISRFKLFESLEAATFDLRQLAFAPQTNTSKDIAMIWLDEETMQNLPYRSPVPRDFLARLNDKILEAKPKLIAYDIFFKDPSFTKDDELLALSLQKGQTYSVMPMRISGCEDESFVPSSPEPSRPKEKSLDGCIDQPLPLFDKALKGSGLSDLPFNPFDSIVRYAKFEFQTDAGKTPSFAALLFEKITGKSADLIVNDTSRWPHLGPFTLTPFARSSGETFIRFAGPPSNIGQKINTFSVYPAHMVLKGFVPATWLKDKTVLVGAAYADLQDSYLTPYYAKLTNYSRMNGVEIHANILSSLLTGQFYYTTEPWQRWLLTSIIIIIVMAVSIFSSPLKSSGTLVASVLVLITCAVLFFYYYGIIVPIIIPCTGALTSFSFGIGWKALTEGRQRRWIKGVFAQYVPSTVVEQLIEHPELVKLGGEERKVTSLFSDIESFTSISERMDPSTLVKFLNEYLSLMNEILFRNGGTIDKYEGDAIIAFFNAPLEVKNHEMAAAMSAIDMQHACVQISKKWKSVCSREIITRIGINTGPAVVGNMGSQDRFDYTAIGDTINLASRLEGTNKFYGTHVIASEMTSKNLNESIIKRPIDRVRVKGKKEAILLYEIMGYENVSEEISKLSQIFTNAFTKFEQRNIDEAEKLLEEILKQFPADHPSKELSARCKRAKENPTWDLVTEFITK